MTKTQRLRNAAEGFLAGLVAAGFEGPFRWAHHQWEGPFYSAWHAWEPASRGAGVLPDFAVGGSANGRTSQGREMLWQIKRTSPFDGYDTAPLNRMPRGLSAEEYLEVWVEGATATEWRQLAEAFLERMPRG